MMFLTISLVLLSIYIVFFVIGIVHKQLSGVCTCKNDVNGKTVIISGATSGIGKETAKTLASKGARLILACRNLTKAKEVKEWIISQTANQNIFIHHLDVSDLNSVREFAKQIIKEEVKVDILINNAGLYISTRQESKQGHEMTLAVNYLGHFLLTNLLLGLLKKAKQGRIINVSSMIHKRAILDFDDMHFRKRPYSHLEVYSLSKLCNILFTKELAHRLQNTNISVNSLHPGVVSTEIINKEKTVLGFILDNLGRISLKTPELGAQTTIHLAVSEEGGRVTGEYFSDCKIAKCSDLASDLGMAKKLWELTEDYVQLKAHEKHF